MGKSTKWAIFNSYASHYQRVHPCTTGPLPVSRCCVYCPMPRTQSTQLVFASEPPLPPVEALTLQTQQQNMHHCWETVAKVALPFSHHTNAQWLLVCSFIPMKIAQTYCEHFGTIVNISFRFSELAIVWVLSPSRLVVSSSFVEWNAALHQGQEASLGLRSRQGSEVVGFEDQFEPIPGWWMG